MLTCCNGLLEFCDVHNDKNQTCFMIWFLHAGLQSCYFVSIEFPKKLAILNIFGFARRSSIHERDRQTPVDSKGRAYA